MTLSWTGAEMHRVMLYMTCVSCGTPREAVVRRWQDPDGTEHAEIELVCPGCGADQS